MTKPSNFMQEFLVFIVAVLFMVGLTINTFIDVIKSAPKYNPKDKEVREHLKYVLHRLILQHKAQQDEE